LHTLRSQDILLDLATRLMDALAFQDQLMAQHLPSQLAAAVVHGAVQLCTKSFQDDEKTVKPC
jgi:hypothetical protein